MKQITIEFDYLHERIAEEYDYYNKYYQQMKEGSAIARHAVKNIENTINHMLSIYHYMLNNHLKELQIEEQELTFEY